MSATSLSGSKYGVHKKIVYVHAATLEEAKYKLKLLSKMSNTSYQHCTKFPIHRTDIKGWETHQWFGALSQVYYLIVMIRKHTD